MFRIHRKRSITSKRPKVDTPYLNSWADDMAKRNANTRNGIPNPPLSSSLPHLSTECPPCTRLYTHE